MDNKVREEMLDVLVRIENLRDEIHKEIEADKGFVAKREELSSKFVNVGELVNAFSRSLAKRAAEGDISVALGFKASEILAETFNILKEEGKVKDHGVKEN